VCSRGRARISPSIELIAAPRGRGHDDSSPGSWPLLRNRRDFCCVLGATDVTDLSSARERDPRAHLVRVVTRQALRCAVFEPSAIASNAKEPGPPRAKLLLLYVAVTAGRTALACRATRCDYARASPTCQAGRVARTPRVSWCEPRCSAVAVNQVNVSTQKPRCARPPRPIPARGSMSV
jgi:hypothetical protein